MVDILCRQALVGVWFLPKPFPGTQCSPHNLNSTAFSIFARLFVILVTLPQVILSSSTILFVRLEPFIVSLSSAFMMAMAETDVWGPIAWIVVLKASADECV